MADTSPAMRAAQLKEDLDALAETLGADQARRILATVPAATMAAIQSATRVDWLPIRADLELVEAIDAGSGRDGTRRWGRAALRRSMDRPLLKPLLDAAVRLFGLSPAGVFRMAPQGWKATFRGCGDVVVASSEPGRVRLELRGAPSALRHEAFLASIAGSFEAIFDLTKAPDGRVAVELRDASDPAFVATWTPPA